MKLYEHQIAALDETESFENVGYFLDMGLGKTAIGAEKMRRIGNPKNIIVCPLSMVPTWIEHLDNVGFSNVYNLTDDDTLNEFIETNSNGMMVGVINYDLIFRRPALEKLDGFTLVLDESSLIQNENAKRSKAILKRLRFSNVILLSGTVVNGNYEKLWSQCHLLGWPISKKLFENQYLTFKTIQQDGFFHKVKTGYKNIDRLKSKLADYGAIFMKSADVLDLPEQVFIDIPCDVTKEYKAFQRDRIVRIDGEEFIGDMQLTARLYSRLLCSVTFNPSKRVAFRDLMESTDGRLIVFYNFDCELDTMRTMTDRPISIVNGHEKDLTAYDADDDSITFVQFAAGGMGLNLQKANRIIYVSLPDGGSELFEQSKKRIHRIGQNEPCFYYLLLCKNSIETESVVPNLDAKKRRIDVLFDTERGCL